MGIIKVKWSLQFQLSLVGELSNDIFAMEHINQCVCFFVEVVMRTRNTCDMNTLHDLYAGVIAIFSKTIPHNLTTFSVRAMSYYLFRLL